MSRNRDWLNLPNRITLARLVIAMLLFVMLSLEIADAGMGKQTALNIAFWVFIVCVLTDWLDGYLARRHGMITTFGRIADPIVDKVVVCGTIVYLVRLSPELIKPWFAVVIVAREFLISGLRSYFEGQGIPFGARWGGKLKMILQSVTIPAVLLYEANFAATRSAWLAADHWARSCFYWLAWALVAATLVATVLSALQYLALSVRTLSARASEEASSR